MMQLTIKDVARRAGVSPATVSRVLTGNHQVSKELKERVQSTIDELNYQPGRLARSLRLKFARTIGIVISDIRDPFFSAVVQSIESKARRGAYGIMLCNTADDSELEDYYLRMLLSERVAGIIFAPGKYAAYPVIESIQRTGISVICMGRSLQSPKLDTILIDYSQGTKQAISHLVGRGHKRIGILLPSPKSSTGKECLSAYKAILQKLGLPFMPELVAALDPAQNNAYDCALNLLTLPSSLQPTSLLVGNVNAVIGTLQAISELGYSIPDDIGIVIFGDPPFSQILSPPLTAIHHPVHELAHIAIDRLFTRINQPDAPHVTVRLPTKLAVRQSSGALQLAQVLA